MGIAASGPSELPSFRAAGTGSARLLFVSVCLLLFLALSDPDGYSQRLG
jgi:hypothetical protein